MCLILAGDNFGKSPVIFAPIGSIVYDSCAGEDAKVFLAGGICRELQKLASHDRARFIESVVNHSISIDATKQLPARISSPFLGTIGITEFVCPRGTSIASIVEVYHLLR